MKIDDKLDLQIEGYRIRYKRLAREGLTSPRISHYRELVIEVWAYLTALVDIEYMSYDEIHEIKRYIFNTNLEE